MAYVMVHPDLPGQPIVLLDPRAIEIHERAGWRMEDPGQRPAVTFDPGPPAPEGHVPIYHPGTKATAYVPPEAVDSYRLSGWLRAAEQAGNEQQAEANRKAAEAADAKASKTSAAKGAASKEE